MIDLALVYNIAVVIQIHNQLLQLRTVRTVWSDPVSWPVFVRSGKYTTISVTEKKVVKGIMLLLC